MPLEAPNVLSLVKPVGGQEYDAADFGRVINAVNAQVPGAVSIAGVGVIPFPDANSLKVARAGSTLTIAAGRAVVFHSSYDHVVIELPAAATVPVDVLQPYVFLKLVATADNDSRVSRRGVVALGTTSTLEGGVLLANTTDSGILDARRFVHPRGTYFDRGNYSATTIYYQDDVVTDAGADYKSLLDGTYGVTPGSDPTKWAVFGSGGGSTWRDGTGAPASGPGSNGDYYLDHATGDVYKKVGGAWGLVANIKGPTGEGDPGTPGSAWYNTNAVPGAGLGINGDYHLNTSTGAVSQKTAGVWAIVANIRGPAGLPGGALNWRGVWVTGTAYAVNDAANIGSPASSYRVKVAHTASSTNVPGTGANWTDYWVLFAQAGANGVAGAPGPAYLHGSGAPASGLGADNDAYLNDDTGDLYRKVAGSWGITANLKGPPGEVGVEGDATTSTKGIAKLSTAPADPANPIAVGDNDSRLPAQPFTEAVQDLIGSFFVAGSGITLNYDDAANTFTVVNSAPLTTEQVQDIVGAMVAAGSNVTSTYDDAAGTLTIASTGGGGGGGGASINTEDVQDIVGALLQAGSNVGISYNDAANTLTITATAGDASTLGGQNGAYYLNRANHTGTQAISTVAGLQGALDGKLAASAVSPQNEVQTAATNGTYVSGAIPLVGPVGTANLSPGDTLASIGDNVAVNAYGKAAGSVVATGTSSYTATTAGALANPSSAPVFEEGAGGTWANGVYLLGYTYVTAEGETLISPLVTETRTDGGTHRYGLPGGAGAAPTGVIKTRWYLSSAGGDASTLKLYIESTSSDPHPHTATLGNYNAAGAVPPSSNTTRAYNGVLNVALTFSGPTVAGHGFPLLTGPTTVNIARTTPGGLLPYSDVYGHPVPGTGAGTVAAGDDARFAIYVAATFAANAATLTHDDMVGKSIISAGGALAAVGTLNLPNDLRRNSLGIFNESSGGFGFVVSAGGSSSVTVPAGAMVEVEVLATTIRLLRTVAADGTITYAGAIGGGTGGAALATLDTSTLTSPYSLPSSSWSAAALLLTGSRSTALDLIPSAPGRTTVSNQSGQPCSLIPVSGSTTRTTLKNGEVADIFFDGTALKRSAPYYNTIALNWVTNGDTNGLFYYLGLAGGSTWSNPYTAGAIGLSANPALIDGSVDQLVDRAMPADHSVHSGNDYSNNYFQIDLLDKRLILGSYAYRNRGDSDQTIVSSMQLSGSADGTSWTVLGTYTHDYTQGAWNHITTPGQTVSYRYFRFHSVSNNSSSGYITGSEVELYGVLSV